MQEEMLLQIRKDILKEKEKLKKENTRIRRIKKLEKTKLVIEYLSLIDSSFNNEDIIDINDPKYIMKQFNKNLYKIDKHDTNGIFVYLGTYSYSNEVDIIHGSTDDRVTYESSKADYREYRDLEQYDTIHVKIGECDKFEKENLVINPKGYCNGTEYYKLQEKFIIDMIKNGQEKAKTKILASNKLM